MTDQIKVEFECPNCSHKKFIEEENYFRCTKCGHTFSEDDAVVTVVDGILDEIVKGIVDKK